MDKDLKNVVDKNPVYILKVLDVQMREKFCDPVSVHVLMFQIAVMSTLQKTQRQLGIYERKDKT